MEQFGARPGCPVDECLAEVRKCKIYIGIFAMRYGSIPAGYDKSMTELEYDEAQRLGLPSYIFVADEKAVKFSIGDIDFEQQEQLKALKKKLTSKHMVEFFSSPDDLANKIGTAIHRELKADKVNPVVIEQGIENIIPTKKTLSAKTIVRRFEIFPQRWAGIEFSACLLNYFPNNSKTPPMINIQGIDNSDYCMFRCDGTEVISCNARFADFDKTMLIIAQDEHAYAFIDTDFYARFYVRAKLVFYEYERDKIFTALKIIEVNDILPDIPDLIPQYFNDIPF